MGRKRKPIITIGIEVQLPLDLVSWLNEMFHDPRTGRAKLGARAQLIERLLREEQQRVQAQT